MGAKGTYVNGLENGKSSDFYENGALKTEGYLKNGEIVGTVTQYYKNGKIQLIQNAQAMDKYFIKRILMRMEI